MAASTLTGASYHSNFSAKSLLKACAPVDIVLERFRSEQQEKTRDDTDNRDAVLDEDDGLIHQEFSALVAPYALQGDDDGQDADENATIKLCCPPNRYMKNMVRQYMKNMEQQGVAIENDNFLSLYYKLCVIQPISSICGAKKSALAFMDYPDPNESGYVTFHLPVARTPLAVSSPTHAPHSTLREGDSIDLSLRVLPYHNDVGVQKVWEAGAALAEFLFSEPQHVGGRKVIEVGAGVGLTSLMTIFCFGAQSVHMTDFTQATLDNLQNNRDLNTNRYHKQYCAGKDETRFIDNCTVGRLDWRDFDNLGNKGGVHDGGFDSSRQAVAMADVMLAADVIYDPNDVAAAVNLMNHFLENGVGDNIRYSEHNKDKLVIIAHTFRNERTFELFLEEIQKHNISSRIVESDALEKLPKLFPCYFRQPRDHIRIFFLRK
jgi:predicted nicotinamide N-methyase